MPNSTIPSDYAPPLPSEPEEDEEREPAWICEHCEQEASAASAREVLVNIRWNRATDGALLHRHVQIEQWCENCVVNDAVVVQDYIRNEYLYRIEGYCSRDWAVDNMYYHEDDGEWYTEPEPEEYEDEPENDMLLNYSTDIFDVLDWPRQNPRTALVFGVELEVEGKHGNTSNDLVALLGGSRGTRTGSAILKYDGSLDDGRGCEIVSLPFTLEQHKAGLWTDLLDSRFQAAAKSGAGTTNCGMHVHINRRALSALTIGKMVVFLNNPENGGFVTTVAQRQSGHYCQRDSAKKHSDALHGYDASRYDIINISGGSTVEVRMFRGNVRPERVLKNIEFCHALVRFCESHGIRQAQRWGAFAEYVSKNRKAYGNLYAFLAEKGYFPAPRNAPAPVADA